MNKITESFSIGKRAATLEYGEIGRQANATVICTVEDTVVLAACTISKTPTVSGFLPLAVDYQEKLYAAGRFPGGFFKREGRPSEKEILTCRLIDRSIRPLFPSSYRNEINVVCSVLSYNPEIDADIVAMIAAFAAVRLSGAPFQDTLGAVRVGRIDGATVICPTTSELGRSQLDLVLAGSKKGILMVESEASELAEAEMVEALTAGHEATQEIVAAIDRLAAAAGNPALEWEEPQLEDKIASGLQEQGRPLFEKAYALLDKQQRQSRLAEIRAELAASLLGPEPEVADVNLFSGACKKLESKIVRTAMLGGGKRIDGRTGDEIRPITIRTQVLPRTHGSALFTRGETQAMVVCTLGSPRDEQRIDALAGEYYDRFLLHYNMPPYATGETGRMMSPKRREIGHGRLAKRALQAVMPNLEEFGYSIRLVSEITESNGSSSMASVCGGSLAMMDAGIELSAPVAGIAMGLIQGEDGHVILSDILGDEDHLGDMDFKVAGTERGITALQMDIKIDSVKQAVLEQALAQAKDGRLHILGKMNEVLDKPRENLSAFAPRVIKIKINVDKIRDVIGKGGATIKSLTETTATKIDVNDDGVITIAGPSIDHCNNAKTRIEQLTKEMEVGEIYEGKVIKILEFGAIVSLMPGSDGLLHISQISHEHVEKVDDHLAEGQQVKVKVIKTDDRGRIRLSMKGLDENKAGSKDGNKDGNKDGD